MLRVDWLATQRMDGHGRDTHWGLTHGVAQAASLPWAEDD
eukprot:gene13581-12363_t